MSPKTKNWDAVVGVLACLAFLAVPFFPDEKLVRLKLLAFELSGLALLAGLILREVWTGYPSRRLLYSNETRRTIFFVLVWLGAIFFLYRRADEASLASREMGRVLLAVCAFAAGALFPINMVWRRALLLSATASAGVIALYGILQRLGGIGPVEVPQMERVIGTHGNPIFFAAALVVGLFVARAALSLTKNTFGRFLVSLSFVLQLIALVLTQTRAAWLAFFAAFISGTLLKTGFRKGSMLVAGVLILAAGVFAVRTRPVWERDQGHLLIWRDTVKLWKTSPVTGTGLGAFHVKFPAFAGDDLKSKWPEGQFIVNDAHNEYLQMLAEAGLVGLGAFLLILFSFFAYARKEIRDNARDDTFFLTLGVLAILIQNLFSVDMRFSLSFATCFFWMGYLTSAVNQDKWEGAEPAGGPLMNVPAQIILSVLIVVGAARLVPKLAAPYQAQKTMAATPTFFEERLLDPAKTISDLEGLRAQYPNEPAVLEKLAYAYAKEIKTADGKVNMAMADKAAATYQTLLEKDPKRLSAYNNLANVYYTTGRADEAVATWKKAVAVDPNFLDAQLNLGKVLFAQGKLKESADHFERVLKIDPKNAEAIVYMKRMVE